MLDHFWKRWIREYLPRLHARQKWTEEKGNPTVNSFVIIVDENTPRGKWPIGRITEVFPGDDGLDCSVRVHAPNHEAMSS